MLFTELCETKELLNIPANLRKIDPGAPFPMVFSATHEYVPLDVFVSRDILNIPLAVCPSVTPLWKNL